MLKILGIATAIFIFALSVILPKYLGPDDLEGCGEKPSLTSNRCKPASAIVAISGGDTNSRTAEAISLFQAGWAPKLIFSGAAKDTSSPSNAAAMRRQAIEAGIKPNDITVEEFARTTGENAQRIREITPGAAPERLILVTSAYHQRRANIEFRHSFADATKIINHPVPSDSQWSIYWWLTPGGWWLTLGETVKILSLYTRGIF